MLIEPSVRSRELERKKKKKKKKIYMYHSTNFLCETKIQYKVFYVHLKRDSGLLGG